MMGGAGDTVQCIFFSAIIFLTLTATATEGQGDGAAAVVYSADPFS
jgi:hypothetical protein